MYKFYSDLSYNISALITKTYSTSFSSAVNLLEPDKKKHIYAIYGFVRFADEIVDTFHDSDKTALIERFEQDYYYALSENVSLNPVLNSFAQTINKFSIPDHLVQSFMNSMKMDLHKSDYLCEEEIKNYIYGSADVVGLMCLFVFLDGNVEEYEKLKEPAMKLGAAFQKVNFLRDLKNDIQELNRSYFPKINRNNFDENTKNEIIKDIENDFKISLQGIKQLPGRSKLAVLVAYYYYLSLLNKLRKTPSDKILSVRIRVNNFWKAFLFLKAYLSFKLKLI